MLLDHQSKNQCSCKKCGSLRFRQEQLYEMKTSANPDYDVVYELFNRQIALVCADCGTVYDASSMSRTIGTIKQRA